MAELSALDFYLIPLRPATVFSGRVNGTPSDPYMTIPFDAGDVPGDVPLAGQTVWFGTTSGGRERGILRLRTESIPTGTASGSLSVAESDDVGPNIEDDDYITVKQDFRLWPIYPRLVQVSDTAVAFYEDYDIAWNGQTINWKPVAVPGPPAVALLEGGQATVSFVGDRSFALAPGATISSWLWTFYDGSGGTTTDANQGTEGSPVTATHTSAGQYLVSLRVTDSNGQTHTAYTWVFVVDPTNPSSVAYTDFDEAGDSFDFESGGGELSLTAHGGATISDFPEGALVVLAVRGTLTTPTATWPFRSNVAFVGYVLEGTVRQDPRHGTVSFRAGTVDAVMRNTTMWPVSLTDKKGPADWTMGYQLTIDRVLSFLWHWRSTLANMTPIVPLEYSAYIYRQDFGPEDMWSQHQNLLKDAWAVPVVNHQGVLHLEIDYQKMLDSEQGAVTERKLLHKGLWLDVLEIMERQDYAWPTNQVKQSGVYYPGNEADVLPLFSEAPGDAPKAFGGESGDGGFILESQANLNIRCGRSLAKDTQRYPTVRARFANEGSFQIAPQEIFPANIEATDNDRGLAWQPDLLPRRISRTFDHRNGIVLMDVDFEPSTTGPAGVTVEMPVDPPPPEWPPWDPPPPPPITPPVDPIAGPCVAADNGYGVYWSDTGGASWEPRNNGLSTDQLTFRSLIWDPWWMERTGGHDTALSILWGCGGQDGVGSGFVVRSNDAGKNWRDFTDFLPDPPNNWDDDPAPTVADLTFIQIHGCIYNKDTFYLLANWKEPGGDWRSCVYKTTTNGLSWVVYAVTSEYRYGDFSDNPGELPASNADWSVAAYATGGGLGSQGTLINDHLGFEMNPPTPAHAWMMDFGRIYTMPDGVNFWLYFTRLYRKRETDCGGSGWNTWVEVNYSTDKAAWTQLLTHEITGDDEDKAEGWESYSVTPGTQFRYIKAQLTGSFIDACEDSVVQWAVSDSRLDTGILETRSIAMDVDTYDGTRIFVTQKVGDDLVVNIMSTEDLSNIGQVNLGTATNNQIDNKEVWAVPRAPHLPETPNFNTISYVFGRYDPTGGVQHIGRIVNTTLTDIGDPTWGTGTARIGAIEVFSDDQHILAIMNDASPSLWETLNQGGAWSQINTVPFSVEFEAASKHWGEAMDVLIGANAAGATRAAWVATPWTGSWTDATGVPGLPNNEIVSIIWV